MRNRARVPPGAKLVHSLPPPISDSTKPIELSVYVLQPDAQRLLVDKLLFPGVAPAAYVLDAI
jgi:hypothetical protein